MEGLYRKIRKYLGTKSLKKRDAGNLNFMSLINKFKTRVTTTMSHMQWNRLESSESVKRTLKLKDYIIKYLSKLQYIISTLCSNFQTSLEKVLKLTYVCMTICLCCNRNFLWKILKIEFLFSLNTIMFEFSILEKYLKISYVCMKICLYIYII